MPFANVRGLTLHYETLGTAGPWLAITPGSRTSYGDFMRIATGVAAGGFRVLLYDRRNCGSSQVGFDASGSEDEVWAEDLHALMSQLNILPAFIGGASAGIRVSFAFYKKFPQSVLGLVLFRVTGGPIAAKQLLLNYYDPFINAARQGGMDAVCAMDHWRACIEARPENEAILRTMPPEAFIEVMSVWKEHLRAGVDHLVASAPAKELRAVEAPALVIPGNDQMHSVVLAEYAASQMPRSTFHKLPLTEQPVPYVALNDWSDAAIADLVQAMTTFMREHTR